MRVRHLQTYLREQNFAKIGDLSVCNGMRIGVDALYFFRTLKSLKDPLCEVSNSLSSAYAHVVDEQLALFDKCGIKPLFVFQGMQPKSHMLLSAQMIGFAMHDAWAAYVKGDLDNAKAKFGQNMYREFSEDIIFFLVNFLASRGYDVFGAPYFATAQLIYFAKEGLIDAIIGPPSTLLFGIPRVIICVDLQKGFFEWVELSEILGCWKIDKNQFVDSCLLAGTEHCLSYPFISSPFSFGDAVEYIRQAPLVKHLGQLPKRDGMTEYLDGYCIAKTLITHPLILNREGEIMPLHNKLGLPLDYQKIVGCRLPRVIYYLLSECLMSSKLAFALALGEWVDEPNANADSMEFRNLLFDLREYNCRTLGLVALRLDELFQTKVIRFQPHPIKGNVHNNLKHTSMLLIPNTLEPRTLDITAEAIRQEMKRQGASEVSVGFCLRWHTHVGQKLFQNEMVNGHSNGHSGSDTPDTSDRILLNTCKIIFTMLESLGYFTCEGGITVFGRALSTSDLDTIGLLILDMLKFGLFTGDPFEAPVDLVCSPSLFPRSGIGRFANKLKMSGVSESPNSVESTKSGKFLQDSKLPVSSSINNTYNDAIGMAVRLACLCKITVNGETWNGHVDFEIACFLASIKLLRRSINLMVEGSCAYVLLEDLEALPEVKGGIKSGLPLIYEQCSMLGVVLKTVLTAPNPSWSFIEEQFPNAANLKGDLQEFCHFWQKIYQLLRSLSGKVHLGNIMETFLRSTVILVEKLKPFISVDPLLTIQPIA